MTKYLMQHCKLQQAQRDEYGQVILDAYGERMYLEPMTVKCRREPISEVVAISEGVDIMLTDRYFLDGEIPVGIDDMLDGKPIKKVSGYTSSTGECEGYECKV